MNQDENEFQKTYDEFRPKIQRYLSHLIGDSEAEDLTQEVFVSVSRAFEDFRGDSKLSTWLYRIATNAAIDLIRSPSFQQNVQKKTLDDGIELDDQDMWTGEKTIPIEKAFIRKEMNDCIRDFIEKLPENYRTVLVLSELEGLKNQEIADILDLSLNTVKIRLHRARAKLRIALETQCDAYWVIDNEFVPDLRNALEGYKNPT